MSHTDMGIVGATTDSFILVEKGVRRNRLLLPGWSNAADHAFRLRSLSCGGQVAHPPFLTGFAWFMPFSVIHAPSTLLSGVVRSAGLLERLLGTSRYRPRSSLKPRWFPQIPQLFLESRANSSYMYDEL